MKAHIIIRCCHFNLKAEQRRELVYDVLNVQIDTHTFKCAPYIDRKNCSELFVYRFQVAFCCFHTIVLSKRTHFVCQATQHQCYRNKYELKHRLAYLVFHIHNTNA